MPNLQKTRLAKVLTIYVISMFLGGILINSLFPAPDLQPQAAVAPEDMEEFAEQVACLMESDWNAAEIQHEDITGLKSIISKKRKRTTFQQNYRKLVAKSRVAHYPPVPVKFQGVLDSAKCEAIRAEITAASKKYLGRPYIYAAKGPDAFDCSGYTSFVMRLFGIEISPGSRVQCKQGKHVDMKDARVGDLLFFSRYGKGGMVTHVGLILQNDASGITVIHANGPRHGIMVENVTHSSYWKHKILFARNVIDPVNPVQPKPQMAELTK